MKRKDKANGNITNLERNGDQGGSLTMDDLTYNYISGTNKLEYVSDNVGPSVYDNDIDNQNSGNYTYVSVRPTTPPDYPRHAASHQAAVHPAR